MEDCSYKIYAHINKINNKVYIGQTKQNPNKRWNSGYKGCNIFEKAIKKYGWSGFEHKILFSNLTKLDANLIEKDLIYYFKSINKSYNITDGGEGHSKPCSDETKKKLRIAFTGRKQSEITLNKKRMNNPKRRITVQFDLNGNKIREFSSSRLAAKETGIHFSNIGECCRGNRKSAGGYIWKYV